MQPLSARHRVALATRIQNNHVIVLRVTRDKRHPVSAWSRLHCVQVDILATRPEQARLLLAQIKNGLRAP